MLKLVSFKKFDFTSGIDLSINNLNTFTSLIVWFKMGFKGLKLNYDFPGVRQFGARKGLVILFLINLLNFADRYVPSAVKQDIIDSLHITDFQSSLPNTGMIVVYMIFAVIFGTISDKEYLDRRYILCGAIIFWSAATSLAGLSTSLLTLISLDTSFH